MGTLIGGVLGGVGSLVGGMMQQGSADQAAAQLSPFVEQGKQAVTNSLGTQNTIGQLLGTQPLGEGTSNAFANYQNSTGHQFQLEQGINALNSSASARGLLNSGGTGKALMRYGQNLGASTFNNYLGNLQNLNAAQTGTANLGLGGAQAQGQFKTAGADAMASGINGALGGFANAFGGQ